MIKRLAILSLLLVFFSSFTTNALAQKKDRKEQWLPWNFSPENSGILLVEFEHDSEKTRGKLEAYLAKKYSYPYKVIPYGTPTGEGTEYSDTTKYKFKVQGNLLTGTNVRTPGSVFKKPGSVNSGYDWRFVNLILKRKYPYTGRPTMSITTPLIYMLNKIVDKQESKGSDD